MKKMRKIFAVLLTLAMVLTMSMTAFAAKTGATLKVKGLATNAQQHVDIYEIYRLDDKDNGWKAADWTDGTGVTPENLNTEEMLTKLNFSKDIIDRVCFLIGHHHTYSNIEGIDYQILVEADFLVNIFEDEINKDSIKSIKEKIFKTKSGIKILNDLYL